jgi:hypothetical protein
MKILFRYKWYNEEKTILHFIAEGDWTWRDYHAGWRPMLINLINHAGNVHVLMDFREQTRATMPVGIAAHLSSFGKNLSPKLSGKAVVIGIPAADMLKLPRNEDGTMDSKIGKLYFADSDEDVAALFAKFQT